MSARITREARAQPWANPRKPYTLKRRIALALAWYYDIWLPEHGGSDGEQVAALCLAAQAAIARRELRADPRLSRTR